jgi:hypothetical protein
MHMTARKQRTRRNREAASLRSRNGSEPEYSEELLNGLTKKLTPAERHEINRYGAYAGDDILKKLTPAEYREVVLWTYVPETSEPRESGYFRKQADRLYKLADALEAICDQADHLRSELEEIELLVHPGTRRRRSRNNHDAAF